MDRLEILDVDHVAPDAGIGVQSQRHVAHQVFDELGVFIGPLGDPFLVGALEHRPDLARGRVFGEAHQFLPADLVQQFDVDHDVRSLVVGAVVRDLLRARAQRLHRHRHFGADDGPAITRLGDPAALVLEQAFQPRDGRALAQEERKASLDPSLGGVQLVEHRDQAGAQAGHIERPIQRIQPRHEARHVGALLLSRQCHVEVPVRHRRQRRRADAQLDRVTHAAHADALDRQMALVALALGVGNVQRVFQVAHGRWRRSARWRRSSQACGR